MKLWNLAVHKGASLPSRNKNNYIEFWGKLFSSGKILKNRADMFCFPVGKNQQISGKRTTAKINFEAQPRGLMWVPRTQLFLQAAFFPPHFYQHQGITAAPARYAKNS